MKLRRRTYAGFGVSLLAALAVASSWPGAAATLPGQVPAAREAGTPRKRAVLVGISKYQRKGAADEWRNLSTELDLELLQQVLAEKFKFTDIVVLRDEKATKEGILSELRKVAAQTAKGDVVFLHYSGHGDSIPDDNGDEIDGKDESLIPFDYVSKKDYSRNIRDDEIGKILDELKKKEPGNVTVSIDSCYSGTATRGDYAVRGGGGDADKPEGESPSGLRDKQASYSKDYIFLAASSPRQTAKETDYDDKRRMGIYTLALVKALNEATPRTTYRDLFERINDIITSKRGDQNPQLEGSFDELVFDGTAVRQERYVAVRPAVAAKSTDKVILQTGRLLGATAKSRYALYAAGTKDPQDKGALKLAEGELVETGATSSVLKLDRSVEADKLRTARAFETQHFYEETALKVVLQDVRRVKGGDAVSAAFVRNNARGGESFDLAEFTEARVDESLRGEAYDVKVYPAGEREVRDRVVPTGFRGLVMERKDGTTLDTIAEGEDLTAQIKMALERENRFRTIKSLKDNEDPRLKIDLRLIPVDVKLDAAGRVVAATPRAVVQRNAGGMPEFKLGDHFMLEVENQGELDVYVTILNLRSDGKIGPGFPQTVAGTPDNLIKRGSTVRLPIPYVFVVTEPLGEESFRAIATIEPTDFTPLIDEELIRRDAGLSGRGGNAADSPLGKILRAAKTGTRSPLAASAPPSWATSSFTFFVRGK